MHSFLCMSIPCRLAGAIIDQIYSKFLHKEYVVLSLVLLKKHKETNFTDDLS